MTDRRLNPRTCDEHRRAQRAMIAHREYLGRGDDELAERAFDAARSWYLRAGMDPEWVDFTMERGADDLPPTLVVVIDGETLTFTESGAAPGTGITAEPSGYAEVRR